MKERDLEEFFREAADNAPPATFDQQDIARGARRVTARRRMAAVGGSLVAAGLLVGGVGLGSGWFGSDAGTQAEPSISRPAVPGGGEPNPRAGGENGPSVLSGPGAGAGGGCGPPDQQLAERLAGQLPSLSEVSMPVAAKKCPPGADTASYRLTQGETKGNVTAILAPVSASPNPSGEIKRGPNGSAEVTVRAAGGKVLIVRSTPAQGSAAPYEQQLPSIAERLAGDL